MFWESICSAVLATLFCSLTSTDRWGSDRDSLYLVAVHARRDIEADAAKKLAPALLATKDAGGVLKGSDIAGNPVIAVPAGQVEKLRKSRAVRSISTDVPKDWHPVRRLKLSYKADIKPNGDDLRKLGVKLVEDYQKGRFMVVETIDGQIDAKLVDRLEGCSQIEYIAPLLQIKAIQPSNG